MSSPAPSPDSLVIDIRELGRRPGSQLSADRTVPAPEHLGVAVIGVPEGADVELQIGLEAVDEGVLVSGTARAHVVGECVRCLEPVEDDLSISFHDLYLSPDQEIDSEDDEARRLEGDTIDLEPVLRDAVVTALPLSPVCRDDCPGLCPQCGARLADDPDHAHDLVDPRWAALLAVSTTAPSEPAPSGSASPSSAPSTPGASPDDTKEG